MRMYACIRSNRPFFAKKKKKNENGARMYTGAESYKVVTYETATTGTPSLPLDTSSISILAA